MYRLLLCDDNSEISAHIWIDFLIAFIQVDRSHKSVFFLEKSCFFTRAQRNLRIPSNTVCSKK